MGWENPQSTPGILLSSRSAKKTWRSASEGFERTSSSKSRASRAIPKANGNSTAASTASISLCAANPPLSSGGTILCAWETMNGAACSVMPGAIVALRSETRRLG